MLGLGLDAQELADYIKRDLNLQVAFPCFPLEASLGHVACCVVRKSWLKQLVKGEATDFYSNFTNGDANDNAEVNVFITVIPKDRPLTQENWTGACVFAQVPVDEKSQAKDNRATPRSNIIPTTIPWNDEWNLSGEAYVWELLSVEEQGKIIKSDELKHEFRPDYGAYRPVLEGGDAGLNEKLVDGVLDMIYPSTCRYRITPSNKEDDHGSQRHRLELVERDIKIRERATSIPPPPNIAAATVVLESERAHFCISPHRTGGAQGLTTLQDLLKFNPGALDSSLKKGFLAYQLLKATKGLHENGLIHGSLTASNIFIDENLWITLTGIKCGVPQSAIKARESERHAGLPKEIQEEAIVMKWARGDVSNFTYLMLINHAAGRRQGDPNVHPIFPWVTDFTGKNVSHGWRDFTKTKFRINKGDEQLDVTYDGPIPHHINDILSDITYYVYLARQTPIPVLCQFVRSKYEPNEYPSSIQRLYLWTPDECIPEFYTDPNIFKSIHSDMPDLALPQWASTPDDFVRIHREALESDYVSQHLHEWIDLTFGYRLSGQAAVDSKNVALALFPGQSSSMKHGFIQIFTDPHPQKACNWSLSKADYLKSQSKAQTSLENALRITKRRTYQRPQSDRPQFVEKVSDLLFRPTGPTRSKSLRHAPPGSRPTSIIVSNGTQEQDSSSTTQTLVSPSASALLLPINSITQESNLAMASTRPEGLAQFIQSEPIDLSKEFKENTFTEELDNFEQTFFFGSKYHFMNDNRALSSTFESGDVSIDHAKGGAAPVRAKDKITYEHMRAWDVYCLGDLLKQIYLAQNIPNNSIAMFSKPQLSVDDLTRSQLIPLSVSGTIKAMLAKDWRNRPKVENILRQSIPALSPHSPNISMFVPGVIADIYDFLAMFYLCSESMQLDLANKWIDRICGFEDETFEIALPVFVHLFTTEETRLGALVLLPKLGQRLGIKRTKTFLLKPITALFESSKNILPQELLNPNVVNEFLRRFGTSTFLQQLFPFYVDSLVADYSSTDVLLDDSSSTTSSLTTVNAPSSAIATTTSTSFNGDVGDDAKKAAIKSIPTHGRIAGEAFIGICRSIGPILTSKHVMRPFSALAKKDSLSLPLLKLTLGGIAQEFGSTFALVQFSHLMHLLDSTSSLSSLWDLRTSTHIRNLLGMLGALVPHMYDVQLVTELKNGGSELIYRLMEPRPRKSLQGGGRLDGGAKAGSIRLGVSQNALDFILQLSFSLSRADWELHIAPILQKYFSGFGPEMDEVGTKTTPSASDVERNEQMMYAYGELCSCVGQEAMQSMIPASDAIERLIAARLDSKEFGNSPLRSLGSITAQGKFVPTSSTLAFWQQQKNQQAKDLVNPKKSTTAFSTKDLWSATSASMSKALSLFDTSKNKPNAVTTSSAATAALGSNVGNGLGGRPMQSTAASALAPVSASTTSASILAAATSLGSLAGGGSLSFGGLATASKDSWPTSSTSFGHPPSDMNMEGSAPTSVGGTGGGGWTGQDMSRSPTDVLSTGSGSLSPVLGSGPGFGQGSGSGPALAAARKTRQNFGSPGKAKTVLRLEQLSNWNRFLSTNQEEMAKSMQFAFNDWKLQGLEGHTSGVKVIGANEYQRILATGSKDRTVKLWSLDIHRSIENPEYFADAAGSGCLMTFHGHRRGPVTDLHFATGGGSFGTGDIVASCDGQIHLWEPETGKTVHQFQTGKNAVVAMVPIQRSRYIVAGMMDNTLSFLDSHTHANLHQWRTTSSLGGTIKVVRTNPVETLIAVGFSNGTVSLLEARTGTLVGTWRASDNEITQMKFYTNDILITSAPADHMVCIWNVHTLMLIKAIRGTSEIVSLEIFKDEIITMHQNNSMSFTPMNDNSLAYTSKFKSSAIRSSISCISILPMNQLLVLGCAEGDLYLYS